MAKIQAKMAALRTLGHPYTDAEIAKAKESSRARPRWTR
jgi:cbb3-type cytochrome oxidase cytochrome c subunit